MYPNSDILLFGSGIFIAGFLSLRLPETHKRAMPESMHDLYDLAGQGQKHKLSDKASTFAQMANDDTELEHSDSEVIVT